MDNGKPAPLAKRHPSSTALAPQSLDDMFRLAAALIQAKGMIPERIKSEGELVATVLAGQELGLGPMASLRGIHVVQGKVGLNYDLMVGLLRRAGYRVEWTRATATEATVRLTAPNGDTHEEAFTKADAQTAGLWGRGQGWQKYPKAMLKARAVSAAARAFAGDVLHGAYSMDEIQEIGGGNNHSPRENFDDEAANEQARMRRESNEWAEWALADIDAIDDERILGAWCEHNRETFHAMNNRYQQNAFTKVWRRLRKAASRCGVSDADLRAALDGEAITADGEVIEAKPADAAWRNEPFGFGKKHFDDRLRDVPGGYLEWVVENARDREAREKAQAELDTRAAEESNATAHALEVGDDPWGLAEHDVVTE